MNREPSASQTDALSKLSYGRFAEAEALWRAQGEVELNYPPDYPKMPGEPPRVQPSRKNPANWPKDED